MNKRVDHPISPLVAPGTVEARLGVLRHSDAGTHKAQPFPHLRIDQALDTADYQALTASFPPLEHFRPDAATLNNRVLRLSASQVIAEEGFSTQWKAFME